MTPTKPASPSPSTDPPASDASATDASATDASATDASATDASATDASATDASATDASATETPTTDSPKADPPKRDSLKTGSPKRVSAKADRPDADDPEEAPATVLVVDDNKAMRVFLSHLLRDRFRVETAESLQAARRELHRHRPDAILLDLELGDGDGYTLLDDLQAAGSPAPGPHEASLPRDASQEVDGGSRGAGGCRRIDARLADVSVLVVSGRSDSADRTKALALGAADYVAKPFHPPELLQRLSIRVDT